MSTRRIVVKAAAAAVDKVRRPPAGLVVLIYHRVGGRTNVEVDLPLALFERQMEFLAERARVVTLDDGLELIESSSEMNCAVAVTFDDGTADFSELAVPVLERYRIPATLYLATDFVERQVPFPDDGKPLSWAALRDVRESGLVDVGSHTHHHALLDRLPDERIASELDRSIELIGEHLDATPSHFAYPKAVPGSPAAKQAVRARFRSAAIAGTRPNVAGRSNPYELTRSPIQVSDDMRWFVKKVRGGMAFEDSLRRLVNKKRYARSDS